MLMKQAAKEDFDHAFYFIERLWDYNTYDKDKTKEVYNEILSDSNSFAFFILNDEGDYCGFCHGSFFNTFWMSGKTCYLASIITDEKYRGKGYGRAMIDHVKEIARKQDCKAIILDSGLPRTAAHSFYERYGFEKSCYGFELFL
ncbi:GNAT family N-acetyltransferase [Agathobacter sp.]